MFKEVLRFNKIVLILRLLGYTSFTDAVREHIWEKINQPQIFRMSDEQIVHSVLLNY